MRRRAHVVRAALALILVLSLPIPIAQANRPPIRQPKPSPPEISDPEVPNGAWMGPGPVVRPESDRGAHSFRLVLRRAAAWILVHSRGGLLR